MGSLNDKEKEFKSVLENLEFEINTEQLWDKVSPHLNSKEKDRPFLFYLLGLALAVMIGGGIVYLAMSDYINSEDRKISLSHNSQSENILSSIKATDSLNLSNSHETRNTNITTKEASDSNSLETESYEAESSFTNKDELSNNSIYNASQFKLSNNRNSISNSGLNISNTVNITQNNLNVQTNGDYSFGALIQNAEYSKLLLNSISDTEKNANKHLDSLDNYNAYELQSNSIPFLKCINLSSLSLNDRLNSYALPGSFTFVDVTERKDNGWLPVFSINAGVNRSISSPRIRSTNSDFKTNEFSKESGLYGFSNSLEFGLENNKGWKLFGGISYYAQNSVFKNSDVVTVVETVAGTGQHIDANGIVQSQGVELQQTTTTFNNVNWNRRHKYIDVGLGVGKEVLRFGALGLSLQTSFHYNLLSDHSGYYFDELSSGIVKFNSNEDSSYKSNSGLSGRIGMSVEWRYKAIGIGVSAFIQYRINSILQETSFYNTNDNHLGLNLTVSYRP